jgi:sulfate adenylyltransferase
VLNFLPSAPYSESLLVHFRRAEQLRAEAVQLPARDLNQRQLCDLEGVLNRAFYPLNGFLCQADYESVVHKMRLSDGTIWPIPICLDVDEAFATQLERGSRIALNDAEGFLLAVLTVEDIWQRDKKAEAKAVYGTTDAKQHPGVQTLFTQVKEWCLGGRVEVLPKPVGVFFSKVGAEFWAFIRKNICTVRIEKWFLQRPGKQVVPFCCNQPSA